MGLDAISPHLILLKGNCLFSDKSFRLFCKFSHFANDSAKEKEGGQYKDTVDLPQTSFSLRANSVAREPEIQKLWEQNKVLEKVSERNDGVRLF